MEISAKLLAALGLTFILLSNSYANPIKNEQVEFSRDHVMITLDPRPSPDDYSISDEYSEPELIHFVKIISSRFSKILIDLVDQNSTSKITSAVANFNSLHRPTPPTQLWLHIPYVVPLSHNSRSNDTDVPLKYLEMVKSAVERANQKFPGSVEGLILNLGYILHENDTIVQSNLKNITRIFRKEAKFTYKLGIMFPEIQIFSDKGSFQAVANMLTAIQACCVMTYTNPSGKDVENGINATIPKYKSILDKATMEIRGLDETREIMPIFRTGYPSTSNNSKAKSRHGDLVQYWKSMSSWVARSTNVAVAMTEAFDVPRRHAQASKSLGWWRLVDNDYKDGTEYVFEEKVNLNTEGEILMETLVEEDQQELVYFREDKNFNFTRNKRFTLDFNPYLLSGISNTDLNKSVTAYLERVSKRFGHLSLRNENLDPQHFAKIPEFLASWNKRKNRARLLPIDTSLVFTPPTHNDSSAPEERKNMFDKIIEIAATANNAHPGTISLVAASFFKDFVMDKQYNYFGALIHWETNFKSSNSFENATYKFGMELPLEVCRAKSFRSTMGLMLTHVKVVRLKKVLDSDELVTKGVDRVMKRVQKKFETCKSKLESETDMRGIEAELNVGWRDTNGRRSKDYQTFLRFWAEMGVWAASKNLNVIMMEAFDNPKIKRELGEFGWWEMVENKNSVTGLGYDFVEKLKVLRDELPPPPKGKGGGLQDENSTASNVGGTAEPIAEPTTAANNIPADEMGGDSDISFLLSWSMPTAVVICIFTVVAFVIVWKRMKNPRELTKEEVKEFTDGNGRKDFLGEEVYINSKYNSEEYEVPLSDIAFDSVIGSGKFGIVYKATIANNTVAVKAPKKMCTKQYYKSMLMEVKIHSSIESHENVLKFIGANTKDIKNGKVFLVTEFCENGTLYAYLRTLRYNLEATEDENAKKLDDIYDLYKFAYEIASGMHFISEKDIIHGDLSTKGVLLDGYNNCKISDFGLSRKLDDNGEYLKRTDESFPWRWIAVETLKHKIVTTRSDIWSYGVTLWEIFSLGRIPYKTHVQEGFLQKLEKGLRLKRPKYATQNVYDNMMLCWSKDPTDRPQFQKQSEYFLLLMREEYDLTDRKNKTSNDG